MLILKQAAQRVVEVWNRGDLAGAVRDLTQALANLPIATEQEVARARGIYAERSNNDIEIDEEASISAGEGGVWVQAWVWLPNVSEVEEAVVPGEPCHRREVECGTDAS